MNCFPAVELSADFFPEELEVGDWVIGGAQMDNLKPFGPDLTVSFEGEAVYASTWAGAGLTEYHAFGSKVRGVKWIPLDPVDFYFVGGSADVDVSRGGFSLPPIQLGGFPPFAGRAQIAFSTRVLVEEGD
jgi:hypothetical protein